MGKAWVIVDRELILNYLWDETAIEIRPQAANDLILIKPADAQQISEIMKLANHNKIPVFPRGGGTGLCGGAIPVQNGIILSLERMKRIQIDRNNLMATAEAGATLGELIEQVEADGLFFPPHPGDESAQIGGLVACNAGGARAVKYGVMRNYVKGMKAILPTGEQLHLGGKLLKNNTGYDLMNLIIGSEGTLAIITEVVLRLFPFVAASATMIVPFNSRHDAVNTVPRILQSGIIPLAVEYVEYDPIEKSARQLGLEWPCKVGVAFLIIVIDGRNDEEVHSVCQSISEICEGFGCLEPVIGQTKKEEDAILKIRSYIYHAYKRDLADVLDIAVPPANMGKLMDAIDRIAERFNTSIPVTGHAGDGNLHPKLMKELLTGDGNAFREVKRAIYEQAIQLDGTMTGEHGLGRVRVPDIDLFLSQTEIKLMRDIKKVFDPNGILNPGCTIDLDR